MQKYILKKQWDSNMKKQDSWGALISQTGSEIIAISKETGYLPSLIVTNNIKKIPEKNMEIFKENNVDIQVISFRPILDEYFSQALMSKTLITLHGYLRIIPKAFFRRFEGKIYNGHPALITKYPELKGLNMQEAIINNQEKYPTCGSVIHEVIPELDSGPVVAEVRTENISMNKDHAYALLRRTSLESWKHFFKNIWKFPE